MENISIVIGSYGSYNACNERALGSEWLNLADFDSWEDVLNELQAESFKLNGIDAELFLQDVDGLPDGAERLHPQELFEVLKTSRILTDEYKRETFDALCEVESFLDFVERVKQNGEDWDADIILYQNMDIEDVAYDLVNDCYDLKQKIGNLACYFDYSALARDLSADGYYEYSNGVIEIR